MFKSEDVNRRSLLAAGGAFTALSASAALISPGRVSAMTRPDVASSLRGPTFDLTTGRGNVDAYLKLTSNLDMKSTHYGWIDGYVMGVAPNGAVKDICGFRGIGCNRLLPYEGPGYGFRRVLREIVFYTDLKTGEILEEMENPFTGEKYVSCPSLTTRLTRFLETCGRTLRLTAGSIPKSVSHDRFSSTGK